MYVDDEENVFGDSDYFKSQNAQPGVCELFRAISAGCVLYFILSFAK